MYANTVHFKSKNEDAIEVHAFNFVSKDFKILLDITYSGIIAFFIHSPPFQGLNNILKNSRHFQYGLFLISKVKATLLVENAVDKQIFLDYHHLCV